MNKDEVRYFIEAALLASDKPLKVDAIESLFEDHLRPTRSIIRECLKNLQLEYDARDIELIEVLGFRSLQKYLKNSINFGSGGHHVILERSSKH